MSKSACKCKKPAECEECPEWIFTFADLVMLMMGFFVILWVLKPAPGKNADQAVDEKWLEVIAKIREAFGRMPDPESKDPVDVQALLKKMEQLQLPIKGPGKGGETREPRQGPEGTDPLVQVLRPGTHVGEGGKILFSPGDAALSAPTIRVLDEVNRLIRGHRNIVLVKGHTSLDDLAEGATPQQKMALSLRRAQVVADYLTSHGVSPDIVRVQGCSIFEPVVQRTYTPDAQTWNRRVEIEATDTLVQERQDTSKGRAAPAALTSTSAAPPATSPSRLPPAILAPAE